MDDTSKPILIKRYASRRLYNTQTSDYVTLDEVAGFIRDGRDIQIVDRKSGEDITRQYLLQIIADQESRGETVLPINVLTDIVRCYSGSAENFIPDFLSQSFAMIKESQAKFLGGVQPNGLKPFDPMRPMEGIEDWQNMQAKFFTKMMGSFAPGTAEDSSDDSGAHNKEMSEKDAEIALIKQQLAEMQDKLRNL